MDKRQHLGIPQNTGHSRHAPPGKVHKEHHIVSQLFLPRCHQYIADTGNQFVNMPAQAAGQIFSLRDGVIEANGCAVVPPGIGNLMAKQSGKAFVEDILNRSVVVRSEAVPYVGICDSSALFVNLFGQTDVRLEAPIRIS